MAIETISVPGPPLRAFRKDRPLSDLLKQQLKHFQHVESRLPAERRSNFTAAEIYTPEGAARYIAFLTATLRNPSTPVHPRVTAVKTLEPRRSKAKRSTTGLALAAAATQQVPAAAGAPTSKTERKHGKTSTRETSAAPSHKNSIRRKKSGGKE